ncbi:uroporphyrinogen decarboxylase family protein [Desulfosporosinus youngiae]|uniref:Uroporphyrinogen decarboxylase (URO-D) n=1 Tax=Desulfosporosinus youngiae DSM 17734 TaxID=768710 RepID=H5XSE9_9FIRM|nr:uroporphyrinogen decarboxylase family protein [Desulfosporosinus youngiae]EHQ87901.1 Uroporphyrinogen decarboxylase (URO-D) [Desulfosporosinus youngiae DSM 17734]
MNKIERILASVRFEKVDRIPKGEFHLEDDFIAELLGLKEKVRFKDRIEACERCGLDALAFTPTCSQDNNPGGWEELEQWRKETDFFIFAIIDGPFQGTAKLFTSFTDYLMAIAKHDPIIQELVTKSVTANLELGHKALALGANGIIVADDIAYQSGTFVSPTALRKGFFPGLAEQVDSFRAQNIPVFFHADGDLLRVMEDIVDIGFSGLHSLDFPSLVDIAKVRMMTKNRLCMMGGYDLSWFAGTDRLEKVSELLNAVSGGEMGSGYIFGSSAGILGSTVRAEQVLDVYQHVSKLSVE